MADEKGSSLLYILAPLGVIVVLLIAGYFLYQTYFVQDQQIGQATPEPNPIAGWNILNNAEFGFQLQYPNSFFDVGHEPKISSVGSQTIPGTSEPVMVNSVMYHHYSVDDAAAGHRYFYDYYQTERNGLNLVITLETSETNCDNYTPASQDQQNCFSKNAARPNILQQIVNTFTFTK